MSSSSNEPKKHHFLPEFYLGEWRDANRQIIRFTKPYGNMVKPKRVFTAGAGYIEKLYAVEGLPNEAKLDMESEFLSPVDSRAADALRCMLTGEEFTQAQRMAWAGFLATLLFRMPDDIARLKENIFHLFEGMMPGLQRIFDAFPPHLREGSGRTLGAFNSKAAVARRAIESARQLMADDKVVGGLAKMEWSVFTVDDAKHDLLTSDRPVIHTNSLNHPDSHLVVPIGPRRLFVAAKERRLLRMLRQASQNELVRASNEFVVSNATVVVCGRSESQLNFIQKRMGKETQPSLMARLPELQRETAESMKREWEHQASHIAALLPDMLKEVEASRPAKGITTDGTRWLQP